MKLDLQRKNILITGAATGMGRATALEVAKHGASVGIADINGEGLKEVSEKLSASGCNHKSILMDVTSIEEVEKKINELEDWFEGGINTLVHFAGALEGSVVDIDELPSETWNRIININLNGTYNVSRVVAKFMKTRNEGVILLTSSGAGVLGPGSSPPYSASKGGTHGLTFNLQNYLGPQGIRVHDILPGNIKSPLKEGQLREALKNTGDEKTYEEHYAELGDPAGVAKIVAFIISDDASYLKGSIVTR
ncbi:MAG: hypothetical protein CL506_02630 [Actinobacteria bacterium]|jgi:NAD(P)-dependent dehydrogenase (short-subunit alcohol dehydrogenase family)|nr:hypothetical protein [Actinomycetota bacterium]|tara:strand:+ start:1355 stop:2104 length:750 start_codon:yes stop_codon:yes gene_type:complete